VKAEGSAAISSVSPTWATPHGSTAKPDSACFTVGQDESSRIVRESRVDCTDATIPLENKDELPTGCATERENTPKTSAEALKLAVSLMLEAGDLDGAAEVIALMKRMKPRPVVDLRAVRRRDDDEGTG
jgi:hypothetical protein